MDHIAEPDLQRQVEIITTHYQKPDGGLVLLRTRHPTIRFIYTWIPVPAKHLFDFEDYEYTLFAKGLSINEATWYPCGVKEDVS